MASSFDGWATSSAKSPCNATRDRSTRQPNIDAAHSARLSAVMQGGVLEPAGLRPLRVADCRQYTLGGSGTPAASYVARDTADCTTKMPAGGSKMGPEEELVQVARFARTTTSSVLNFSPKPAS